MLIDDIIPYAGNARHNEKAVPVVAESIKEFGLRGQIVLESRKNPVIVAGHTRWAACKSLGWKEIPDEKIDFADDLTEDQIKAFRLADNRTGEVATWNQALLKREVKELTSHGVDMSKFRFDFKSKFKSYGAERARTTDAYNLGIVDANDCDENGMPTIYGEDYVPDHLLGFNYAKSSSDSGACIHYFIDDYQFERLWNKPDQYVDLVGKFEATLTPDFSIYLDMPKPMMVWNEYRRRALGHYWQRCGFTVVPTLSWATPDTYEFCFGGLPKRSTVAVSTVGILNDKKARKIWRDGMAEALKILEPNHVLVYGGKIEFAWPENVDVRYYEADGRFGG